MGQGVGRSAKNPEGARLDPAVQGRIGAHLRAIYVEKVEHQPIPNEHVDLLLALRRKERDRRNKS